MRLPVLLAASALAALAAAPARAADTYCTGTYGGEPARSGAPLRFGIDPELAGSTGVSQSSSKPEDDAKRMAALAALRPPGRELVLRVNRLFWSDGDAGIARFQQIVGRDTAAGYDVELQVRYHPNAQQEGDIAGWTGFVRHVVDVFGPNRRVVAMTITNENNINVSPNTSDGGYKRANDALVQGIEAAHDEATRRGYAQLRFGFTYAYRFNPGSDAALWQAVAAGGPAFRAALGFVGLDVYPGSFYPPVIAPTSSPGAEVVKALATVRDCFMVNGGLSPSVPIWITENGYPTTPGAHTEAEQAQALGDMVDSVLAYSGTYGVTDYRWFNLRDNDSTGTGMFDTDGLLRDDYSPKPSFAALRDRIAAAGALAPRAPARRRIARRTPAHRRAQPHHHRRRAHRHGVRRHRRVRHRAARPRFTG